ncbi:MAG: glycerol-3-phosphate dehydrogenase, partial [Arenibacter algicola]|nr:glycerol-3-phosphate dehydrogenase [Arenibacter algicola]
VHGGLRYLEHYEFALVRESLKERAILLDAAPHIVHPQSFVLPHGPGMRPAWLLRIGLFLYDHLGTRHPRLPASRRVDLRRDALGQPLVPGFGTGFTYADCTVDDSRLVVLNALDAHTRGATIAPYTRLMHARRDGALWHAVLRDMRTGGERTVHARAMANVAGPWARAVIDDLEGVQTTKAVRLVKGSHIVVPRLYNGDQAYILQSDDGRVVFVIPYERDFTLIGTTEVELDAPPPPGPTGVACSDAETAYLCGVVNRYFTAHIAPEDVAWSFAGVRPLFQEKSQTHGGSASAATREYAFEYSAPEKQAPLLSVFGGKLTTYRRLAERAVDRLCSAFPNAGPAWTAHAPLPGGDLPPDFADALRRDYPDIDPLVLHGLIARHGTRARTILGPANTTDALGAHFGH